MENKADMAAQKKMNNAALIRTTWIGLLTVVFLYAWILFSAPLINDDYMALYTTWRMSLDHIAGIDFNVDSYTLLFNLLVPVFSLLGERFEVVFFYRFLMLLVLLGIATRLWLLLRYFVSPAAALITILLLFLTSPMYGRGLDIRPDPIILLIWLQIVLLLVKENALDNRKMSLLGILLGIAFLLKFKSVIILISFSIHFLYAVRRGAPLNTIVRAAGSMVGGFVLALFLFGLLFGARELDQLLQTSVGLMGLSASGAIKTPGLKSNILKHFFVYDFYYWLLFFMGTGITAGRFRKYPAGRSLTLVSLLLLLIFSLALNPHYYTYNLVTLYPLMAIFVAFPVQTVVEEWRKIPPLRSWIYLSLMMLLMISLFERIVSYPLCNSMVHQQKLHRFIQDNTSSDQAVFAYEGIGIFRPSTYHWRTSGIMLGQYHKGEYNVWREIVETKPVLVILSYRVPGWLLEEDKRQLLAHYTPIAPDVLTLGFETDSLFSGALLRSGFYQVINEHGKSSLMNGKKVEDRSIHWLDSGVHTLQSNTGRSTLRWYFNPESLEMLTTSSPERHPYLVAPTY